MLRLHTSGVSKATWPAGGHQGIATSWLAQHRRLLVMKRTYWHEALNGALHTRHLHQPTLSVGNILQRMPTNFFVHAAARQRTPLHYTPTQRLRTGFLFAVRVFFFVAAAALILLLTTHYDWSLLMLLVLLCLATTAAIVYLLFNDKEAPATFVQPGQAHKQLQRSPLLPQFPDTPMPATPLIRVLETIDLSTSSVEHFINGAPDTAHGADRDATTGAREHAAQEPASGNDR